MNDETANARRVADLGRLRWIGLAFHAGGAARFVRQAVEVLAR